jgi:flavin reductase (DIM6/NTAB) family NADH-FMN oxidoreductase RutF
MTATAVAPVSARPAQILVAINNAARCGQSIAQSKIFAVNFLSQQDAEVAQLFSRSGLAQEEKFALGEWSTGLTGAPVLTNSLAAFDCSLVESHQYGTHSIFIGSVLSVTSRQAPPLLYRDGAYSRNAATI